MRLQQGRTQEHIAQILGVTGGAISSYELGDSLPTLSNAILLAKTFEVSLDWLILGGTMASENEPPEEPALTEEEIRVLIAFRKAPKIKKRIVLELLEGVNKIRKG